MKRVCIDVGGTFTDCLVLDESGELCAFKASTTPSDPSEGLLNSVEKAASFYGQGLSQFLGEVDLLIHGTTLATNTVLTGKGARTGMITTKGFRDVIEIRRGIKSVDVSLYNIFIPPYKPLVKRRFRIGVGERTLNTGAIETPLDEGEVREAVARLKAAGVEAVAVCFLYSYLNPANERRAVEIVKEEGNGLYVAASHDVLPVWREYERFSTTVISAYLGPKVARYLRALEAKLAEGGFRGDLLMMLANGLVDTVDHCVDRTVYLLDSGPAAAPPGALYLGSLGSIGKKDLLSMDMGGTSFDVCLLRDGEVPMTTESWVGDERVAIKKVDVHSVGAGGGSIAWIDSLGLLRVGPQSAGAEPGPACYAQGGEEPTVTDADLILGYVPADFFLGGSIKLDPEAARNAISKVAEPLGRTVEETAQSMFTTVNQVMADQISEVSTRRGWDVRDFTLVAGGGAGPVHAAGIAELLGIPEVVIPSVAALYSAFGMFAMDIGRDYARSYPGRATQIDVAQVARLYDEMEQEALEAFQRAGVAADRVAFARSAEMRYVGQFHEVEVEVPSGEFDSKTLETVIGRFHGTDTVISRFHDKHEALYTFSMPWLPVEFLTFRLKATAPKAPFELRKIASGSADASAALKRRRACIFGGQRTDTPVYDGEQLLAGNVIEGPAIIEEPTTTVVVPGGFRCTVDEFKNYLLRQ